MNDLHVDHEFPTAVVDHEHPDAPATLAERALDPGGQAALVDDRQALLDVTGLGHGDDQAVLPDVQDAVLLEDGAEHGLDDDAGGRVADERTLLVQLAGEEVDAEVAVLARLAAHADADDLRRPALQQQDVADADEVALDGHALAAEPGLDVPDLLARRPRRGAAGGAAVALADDHLVAFVVVAVVVVAAAREGVHDPVGRALHAAAEAVVLTFVVVVAHLAGCFFGGDLFLLDGDVCLHGSTALVFDVVRGVEAAAIVSLGDVELGLVGAGVVGLLLLPSDVDVVSGFAAVDVYVNVDVAGELSGSSIPDKARGVMLVSWFSVFHVLIDRAEVNAVNGPCTLGV